MDTVFSLDTTIFAWATAAVPAARAILRISGPETFRALSQLFTCDQGLVDFRKVPHQILPGVITIEGELKVRVWLWVFPGPHSFSGQDLIELHTLSSPPLLRLIDRELTHLGLTPAKGGEFSARAFLLGKMDLSQAQAVQQLVSAENDAQIQGALNLLAGSFHRRLEALYRDLSDLAVALEANIDFSEEQIETISLDQTLQALAALENTVRDILHQAIDARSLSVLPRVFLTGIANAGKSTLLNRLSGLDRAICSPLAGTTRDILTAPWRYRDRELLLCDTPGLTATPSDEITRSAVDRTVPFLHLADLTIFVLDATRNIRTQLQLFDPPTVHSNKTIFMLNKTDLIDRHELEKQITRLEPCGMDDKNIFPVSAWTGEGLAELTSEVFSRLSEISLTTAAHAVALDLRGREILENTLACLNQAQTDAHALKNNERLLGLETLAVDIQHALRTLGALLGKDVTEDVLETIFSKFCIGK